MKGGLKTSLRGGEGLSGVSEVDSALLRVVSSWSLICTLRTLPALPH